MRRGVTLIELLIVILVMLMITGLVIPVVAPALSNRKAREGARMVEVFFAGARNRAFQTGRSIGVSIERNPANPSMATTLRYVEVMPPYAGDQTNSRALIADARGWLGAFGPSALAGTSTDIGWKGRVRPGDLIQFGYRPTLYRIYAGEPYIDLNGSGTWDSGAEPFVDLDGNMTWTPPQNGTLDADGYFATSPTKAAPNWSFSFADQAQAIDVISSGGTVAGSNGAAVAYSIQTQPTPSAAGLLQLPDGVAIDLGWMDLTGSTPVAFPGSGTDDLDGAAFVPNVTATQPTYANRVIVTFKPSGAVDLVYSTWWNGTPTAPGFTPWSGQPTVGPIYFLIGDSTRIGGDPTAQANQVKYNFQSAHSLLVVVNPTNGSTRVERNVGPDLTKPIAQQIFQSRSQAREGSTIEAR